MAKQLVVEMADGSKWAVPVMVIAKNRADYYAGRMFDGDMSAAVADSLELFEDEYELEDWARNNMNWSDVEADAVSVKKPACDYQEGWMNPISSSVENTAEE